ncbi:MAG: hypothetical protein JNM07_13085 [Phycisphaerae bacterium]|nr:hypothetical protein [Phycisphaerae bacterium]
MNGVVCYVERGAGGSGIRRLRLIGGGDRRVWELPSAPAAPSPGDAGASATEALDSIRRGAAWIADQLRGGARELSAVCLDAAGSICTWLDAPGDDDAVVAAALSTGEESRGPDEPIEDGAGAGVGKASSWSNPAVGYGIERSVQALADPAATTTESGVRRLAVVSVPDAEARVLVDELDALGVVVRRVMSLWHALAAWDAPRSAPAPGDGVLDSSSDGIFASIIVEPAEAGGAGTGDGGRLVWSWSRGGELLAGGSMRLRAAPGTSPAGAEPSAREATLARRTGIGADEPRPVLLDRAAVGRLAGEWIGWSLQLGGAPARVVCLLPPGTTSGAEGAAEASSGEMLVRAWPDATVDVAFDADPVGSALARLAREGTADESITPRGALMGLSTRPGTAHRWAHGWSAAALACAGLAVGTLGWRIGSASGAARDRAAGLAKERLMLLGNLTEIVPDATTHPDPARLLDSKLSELNKARSEARPERPVMAELTRVLTAIDDRTKAVGEGGDRPELSLLTISSGGASVTVRVGGLETGPLLLDTLLQSAPKTKEMLLWTGSGGRATSGRPGEGRTYVLNGRWMERAAAPESGPPTGASTGPPGGGTP